MLYPAGHKPSQPLRFGKNATASSGPAYGKVTINAAGQWQVPDHVSIPVVAGDGIGREIMTQATRVVDKAVNLAYGGTKSIQWLPFLAGESATATGKPLLPPETIQAIQDYRLLLKGPLNTPIGQGFRSINVELRKMFDLFACIRPIKTLPGVETPLKDNKQIDLVIFRENTEDVYKGYEFEKGSAGARELQALLKKYGMDVPDDAGIGIKPISEAASKRIVAKAIQYALDHGRPSVTIMHKGNIQKFTEGAFLQWGKEVAKQQFGNRVILPEEFKRLYGGDYHRIPKGKVLLQECIADNMFQQVTLNPQYHSVIVTTNLNGDYLSDDAAANVGGLGLAPGANIGEQHAVFEAIHGTAPDIAGQNKANPTALFLTTVMMLNQMGWSTAADKLLKGIETALANRQMTGDLARHIPGTKALSTTEYTDKVIEAMEGQSAQAAPGVTSGPPSAA